MLNTCVLFIGFLTCLVGSAFAEEQLEFARNIFGAGDLVKTEFVSSSEDPYDSNYTNNFIRVIHVYRGDKGLLGKICSASHHKPGFYGVSLPAFTPPLEVGEKGIWYVTQWDKTCYTHKDLNDQLVSVVKLPARERDANFTQVEQWAQAVEQVSTRLQGYPSKQWRNMMPNILASHRNSSVPEIEAWIEQIRQQFLLNLDVICPGNLVKAEMVSSVEKRGFTDLTFRIVHVYKGNASLLIGKTFDARNPKEGSGFVMSAFAPLNPPLQQGENIIWFVGRQFGKYKADIMTSHTVNFVRLPAREGDPTFDHVEQWAEAVEDVVTSLQQQEYTKDNQEKAVIQAKSILQERYFDSAIPEIRDWVRYVVEDNSRPRIRRSQ